MAAALLEAHGVRAGAFLSPHLTSFAERIRVGDRDLEPDAFGAAVERAAAAAAKVDRGLEPGDRVTQFELITAAAFAELARQEVEVAVVEAGLGGRHDATGVLRAPVVVLTNVGLEHTRWLGPTIGDIAREKLAVVRAGRRARARARPTPRSRRSREATGARIVAAGARWRPGCRATSARTSRWPARPPASTSARWTPRRSRASPARITVPGRLQVVGDAPLTILDGAHNPSGIAALAAALPEREWVGGRLDPRRQGRGRDAAARCCRAAAASSAPRRPTRARCRRPRSPRSPSSSAARPRSSRSRAPRYPCARAAGPEGAVIATGSIYLIADLVSAPGARRASAL